jgi:two-component system, LytTR family, response regulator
MNYKVYVVEDEKPARARLEKFISKYHEFELIGFSDSGKKAALDIEAFKPDLIFLDIQLTDITGIDLLHLLSWKPLVIFTTAFNEYAIQAFDLQAIDYLLKPFSEERFNIAVDKALKQLSGEKDNIHQFKQLLNDWKPQADYLTRIPSKIGDKIYIINEDDIVYITSEDKLVFAYLFETKYLVNYTLEQLKSRLNPDKFFRIHRSTIVNMDYVKTIETWFAGGYRMIVKDKNKTELTISRSAGKLLRQKLGW